MVNCFLLSTEHSDPEIEFPQLTCIEKDSRIINQKYTLERSFLTNFVF